MNADEKTWQTGFCQVGNCGYCPGEISRPTPKPPIQCTCTHHKEDDDRTS